MDFQFSAMPIFSYMNNYFANLDSIVNYNSMKYNAWTMANNYPQYQNAKIDYNTAIDFSKYWNTSQSALTYSNPYGLSLSTFKPFIPDVKTISYSPSETLLTTKAEKSQSKEKTNSTITINDEDIKNAELKPGLFKGQLAGQEALVCKICKKYNVPPALVASIIILESGNGTSNLARHNNFGGYRAAGDLGKNEKGFGYFSTIEKGLEAMISNIAKYPERYKDVDAVDFANLDDIGRHYCEGNVWPDRIRNVYNSTVQNYLA